MSLSFVFGCSGAGKSRYIYNEILKQAKDKPNQNFLIVVPDQFTMQTQKDLVTLSPEGCIMNIDVLSFSRLTHRIFEECGYDKRPVLDDTGKSLILRKIAADISSDLPLLGRNLSKQGYIHEVKSSISEFMQYGIGEEELDTLISCAGTGSALHYKLRDLKTLYSAFSKYIEGSFITKEETLDLVCDRIDKSNLVKGSAVVFDGFTGFTPVQYRLLSKILMLAEKVYITLTIPGDPDKKSCNPYEFRGVEDLFYLSRKTVKDLSNICNDCHIGQDDDIYLPIESKRAEEVPELKHLEKHLFRLPLAKYESPEESSVRILECANPREEVLSVATRIRELVRDKGYEYRDISIICGDLNAYASHIRESFAKLEIPVYIDETRHIALNPLTEFIKSGLSVIVKKFSYDSIFHYLRTGMSCLEPDEVDELENYCVRFDIKGESKYTSAFTKMTKELAKDPEGFDRINSYRDRLVTSLEPLMRPGKTVRDYTENLYEFLVSAEAETKLIAMEEEFTAAGELEKAAEYRQIYERIMDLLDQVMSLLGDETMSLKEYADILEAGFGEIKIGTIPQNVDRILVGDNKRSRLKEVKALIFMGVNDDYIPAKGGSGGLINDYDRDMLKNTGIELSPGPREQMYIQRYYLYLNLTKASKELLLSYSKAGNDGKSTKPAYLIGTFKGLFEGLGEQKTWMTDEVGCPETPKSGLMNVAGSLRRETLPGRDESTHKKTIALLKAYMDTAKETDTFRDLLDAAFCSYTAKPISIDLAKVLYKDRSYASASELEMFAGCQYRHFLKYGLIINDRDEYNFESKDIGTVAHAVLEEFTKKLSAGHISWLDFDRETGERLVDESISEIAVSYNETILYASARNKYMIDRLKRILRRSVFNLQSQLKKGSFVPESVEKAFWDELGINGRIDRFDICEEDGRVLVKIIDYKTGNKKFDLGSLYLGLQIQLAVYMQAALEIEKKKHPGKDVVPAAMLYYHVTDPVVKAEPDMDPEKLEALIDDELRMTGPVNSDKDIVKKLDSEFETKSDVIPVKYTAKGEFDKSSEVYSEEELEGILDYVSALTERAKDDIFKGLVEVNPCEYDGSDSCKYCDYKGICGFDPAIKGYKKRVISKINKDEAKALILEDKDHE